MSHTSNNPSIPFLLSILLTLSCDKTPVNGVLDGMWQITSVETPDTTINAKSRRAYLSIQLRLSEWDSAGTHCYARFTHEGDSIRFFDFAHQSLHRTQADDDEWVTPEEMADGALNPWGIHTVDARFHVNRLNGSTLILQAADTILTFRKL